MVGLKEIFGRGGLLASRVPSYEVRAGQLEMAEAVGRTLEEGGTLLVEAGPGTGKTFGYLVPSILLGKRVVVSTGTKNLQEQIFFKDLPLLQDILPQGVKAVYMKGRENYLCLRRLEAFLRQPSFAFAEEERFLKEIIKWAEETERGDRSELGSLPEEFPLWKRICSHRDHCLGTECPYFKACFITRMRQEAAEAALLVVNHHLLFADLTVREVGAEVIPRYLRVVFDEAHQLEEVATQYFGVRVSSYQWEELVRDARVGLQDSELSRDLLTHISEASRAIFFAFLRGRERCRIEGVPPEAKEAFCALQGHLERLRGRLRRGEGPEFEALLRRSLELEGALDFVLQGDDPDYVFWCEVRGKGVFLHASPLTVSKELKRRLYPRVKSLIFTSATLTTGGTFDHFKERLGIERSTELLIPSPFDFRRQAVIYIPPGLPDPNSPEFVREAATAIEAILRLTEGRAFVLFTSYDHMYRVHSLLRGRLPFPLLLQGERSKRELLDRFRREISSVLFATSSFWEGVDVKGEALSCVIIDRLPFDPPNDPVLEARCERISREGGNPFSQYQLPEAIITLRQGLGRLIRGRDDRGVLCILDNRLLTRSYGRIFLKNLPPAPIVYSLREVEEVLRSWEGWASTRSTQGAR